MKYSHLLALSVALLTAVPAFSVSIDEFDGEIATTSTPFTIDGSMLGGERDVNTASTSSFSSTGGLATYNANSGITNAQLYWDGNDDNPGLGYGLGGFDLTAGGADRFLLSVTAFVSNPSVAFTIYDSSGNSLRSGPTTITSTGVYEILFSSLTVSAGTGASFTNVNALQLTMSDNTASGGPGSITVDYLRTNSTTDTAVPEPSSVVLMGFGLVALGYWRRKKSA